MKNLLFLCFIILSMTTQAQKVISLDKSPLDYAYFPINFSHDRGDGPKKVGNQAFVRVLYSRPAKKEREVFGKLIPYGQVWRAGANECTEIKFYKDVKIQGKSIKAGTYSLFAIPNESEWTIILNGDTDYWGAYSYKEANDIARFKVPVKKAETMAENFTIQFAKDSDKNAVMQLVWDMTLVELPIEL